MKAGYPPRTLTLIPELPLESLGIKGEQLTVNAKAGMESRSVAPPAAAAAVSGPRTGTTASQGPLSELSALSSVGAAPSSSKGPDYVEFDGGYLVHQVGGVMRMLWLEFTLHAFRSSRTIIHACFRPLRWYLNKIRIKRQVLGKVKHTIPPALFVIN